MENTDAKVLIGVGSYALRYAIGTPDFDPPQRLTPHALLDKAAELGADVLQILDNVPLASLCQAELRALRRHAGRLGLTLEAGFRGSRPEDLRRNMACTTELGATLMRIVLTDEGWEPSLDEVAAILIEFLPELRAAGVTLAIENRFHFYPTEIARLIHDLDDPHVRACLDVMNSITKLVSPREAIDALLPYALSVHIKDAKVTREGTGFRIRGCKLGQGQIGAAGIVAQVRAAGQARSVLVEGWMDPLPGAQATVDQEAGWVKDGIILLRQLWTGDGG